MYPVIFFLYFIFTPHSKLFGRENQGELDGRGMWNIWGERKFIQNFGGETLRKKTVWEIWA